MASQAIWIGIAVGVFFAGLGIGYAAFQSSPSSVMLESRQQMMGQMMMDSEAMQQMHDMMLNDPTHRDQMMNMMQNITGMHMNP